MARTERWGWYVWIRLCGECDWCESIGMKDDNVRKSNVSYILEVSTEVVDCGKRWVSVGVWVSENWVCGGIEYVGGLALSGVGQWSKRTPPRYFYGYVVL